MTDLTFRIWDKVNKKFLSNSDLQREFLSSLIWMENGFNQVEINRHDNYEITQSSGLKDSKGNLIFEGDILKYENNEEFYLSKVKYEEGCFWSITSKYYTTLEDARLCDFICGNKFKNPDLWESI